MVIFLYSERPVLYDEVFDLLSDYDFERKDISVDMLRDEIVDFENGDYLLADPKSLEKDDRILDLYRFANKDVPFVIAAPRYPQSVMGEILRSWELPKASNVGRYANRVDGMYGDEWNPEDSYTDLSGADEWESSATGHWEIDRMICQTPLEEAAEVIQQLSEIILSLVQVRYGDSTQASGLCEELILAAEKMRGIRRGETGLSFSGDEKNMLRKSMREHDDHVA